MKARHLNRGRFLVQQALDEAVHVRAGQAVVVAALAIAVGGTALREFNFGAEEARFLVDFAEGAIVWFGTALTILLGLVLVHGGISGGAAAVVLMRGVRRPEWLVSRWIGLCAAVVGLVLAGYFVLGGMLVACGHGLPGVALLHAAVLMGMRLAIVAAFVLLACTLAHSLVWAALFSLALTLAAHLAPIGAWAAQHGGRGGRIGWTLLGAVVPNFAAIDATRSLWSAAGYAAACALLYLTAACLVFSRREL